MDGGILRIRTKLETKDFDAQIKYLQDRANEISKVLESDLQMPVELRLDEKSRLKMRSDLSRIKNQIINLQEQGNKGIDLKTKNAEKGFENLFKSARKFAFGLISVRGIYSILSKASSAYMSTDERTTNQMEANWVGLGAILSPIIDMIVKLFKKAVTSILYFMSVLTGTNYITKANEAALKKQSSSMDKLNNSTKKATKSLLKFDEANVLTSDTDNKTNEIDTSVLFDINDISENTRKNIEKIATALKPVYDIVKDIINWCLEHPDVILGMLGAALLLKTVAKIIGFAGAGTAVGTGLAGILGLLTALASIWIIKLQIDKILEANDELQKTLDKLHSMEQGVNDLNTAQQNTYTNFIKNSDNSSESIQKATDLLLDQNDTRKKSSDRIQDEITKLGIYNYWIRLSTGALEADGQALYNNTLNTYKNVAALIAAEKQGKLTKEQTDRLTDQLLDMAKTSDIAKLSTEKLAQKYDLTTGQAEQLKFMIKNASEEQINYSKTAYGATTKTDDLAKAIGRIPSTKSVKLDVDTNTATQKTKSWWKNLVNDGFIAPLNLLSNNIGLKFKIPFLAKGGIVNNPGQGVFMGNYVAGERGPEAVLPLNEQTLSQLGQQIGRYITINNMIDNNIDGRRLNRVLATSRGTTDFASNK